MNNFKMNKLNGDSDGRFFEFSRLTGVKRTVLKKLYNTIRNNDRSIACVMNNSERATWG